MVQPFGQRLTEGSILKNIWVIAWPLTLSHLLLATYHVVDIYFVAKLGAAAIAIVVMGGTISNIIWMIMAGLGTSIRATISRFVGAKEEKAAADVAIQSILLSLMLGVLIGFIGSVFARPILVLLGAEPEVLELGVAYIRIIAIGEGLSTLLMNTCKSILEGAGDAKTPMRILIFSNIVNMALLPILIYGWGPIPRLGVYGAAWATIIAESWGALLFLRFLRSTTIGPEIFHRLRADWSMIWRLLRIAFPRSLQRGLEVLAAVILIRIVAEFGTAAVAAYGIGFRLDLAFKSPGWGLGTAADTLVGQSLGAQKPSRAEKSAWVVAGLYVMLNAVAGLLFILVPERVMAFFTVDPEVIQLGVPYLQLMYWGFLFMAVGMIFERALGGSGDTVSPLVITGIGLMGLKIPLALFLPHSLGFGVFGLWLAIAVSYGAWGVAMALWFHRGGWKEKKSSLLLKPYVLLKVVVGRKIALKSPENPTSIPSFAERLLKK